MTINGLKIRVGFLLLYIAKIVYDIKERDFY